MSKPKVNKRLHRLVSSGICACGDDAEKYSKDLKQLAEETSDVTSARIESKFFKALADETRLRILGLLGLREMCVCEVMVALSLTQPTASHHLGLLENAGLVKARKEGKWVFYSVANPELFEDLRKLNIL